MVNSFDSRSALTGPVGGAENRLSSLLDRIPGYAGYRDKENRRDADRAVRDSLSAGLSAAAERVERVSRDLANRRRLREVSAVDSWLQALRHLRDRIQTASYGYGGIFGGGEIDAAALDQLRLFDEALLVQLQILQEPIEALEAALVADGDFRPAIDRGLAATRQLSTRFDDRGSIARSGKPSPAPLMTELLEPSAQPPVPQAWHLDVGDALTVSGDDFLVDARLHVAASADPFRLFRLSEPSAGRWLYVPHDVAERSALVRLNAESDDAARAINHTGSATAELIGPSGPARSATATYEISSEKTDADARTIVVAWPDERMVWLGRAVASDEITIYGPPEPSKQGQLPGP